VKYIKLYEEFVSAVDTELEELVSSVDTELEEITDLSQATIIIHGWNVY